MKRLSGPERCGSNRRRSPLAGYAWNAAGENCDAYGTGGFNIHSEFAIDIGNAGTNYGHRTNMMNASFREIGIAAVQDTRTGVQLGPLVVTEDFGNRSGIGNAYLPVVVNGGNVEADFVAGLSTGYVNFNLSAAAAASIVGLSAAGDWWVAKSSGSSFANQYWGAWSPNAGWQPVLVGRL